MEWSVKKEKLFEGAERLSSFLLAKRREFLANHLQHLFFWYFSCVKKSTFLSLSRLKRIKMILPDDR
jgi:hypothetical protein